ncbi:DUF3027 domain-containing protein [Agromyces bracchium]|uniref:DUF3027 domain-containing protein n=1 Tax=Agromyces bracchium TaxID=88376 RepID=A0A6I3MJ50_9MICO|nr:DUF3027 domain-containing protein [Agromyces bracchium]MTH70273.1 DUF3027 domain-containing protein [Agromyces bracchium]
MPDEEFPGDSAEATEASEPGEVEASDRAGITEERAPIVADEVLLAAVDLARGALLEVTAPQTVGSVIGHVANDDHVLSLHFAADLPGYPGWHWSVTLARVEGADPTVLETELLPGERALLAPEWVPWSERLAEYRAAQLAAAAEAEPVDDESDEADGVDDGAEDDELEDDGPADADDDFGDEDAGDDVFDGIDIDALDASGGSGGDGADDEDAADVGDDRAADDDDEDDRDDEGTGDEHPTDESD